MGPLREVTRNASRREVAMAAPVRRNALKEAPSRKESWMSLPKREELWLWAVAALPNASRTGVATSSFESTWEGASLR